MRLQDGSWEGGSDDLSLMKWAIRFTASTSKASCIFRFSVLDAAIALIRVDTRVDFRLYAGAMKTCSQLKRDLIQDDPLLTASNRYAMSQLCVT